MYRIVKVREITEDEKGKQTKKIKQILVKAVSATDAEVQVTEHYKGTVDIDWEIKDVIESTINEIVINGRNLIDIAANMVDGQNEIPTPEPRKRFEDAFDETEEEN